MASTYTNPVDASSNGVQSINSGVWSGSSLTQYSTLTGGASNAIVSLGAATNGQLVIGSSGTTPVLATLSAGTGISITNGAGSISIAVSAEGSSWVYTSGIVGTLSVETGYFFSATSTATLPTAPSRGATIIIYYVGASGHLVLTAGTGDTIQIGAVASSSAGTATSTAQGNEMILTYESTSATWWARAVQGNWLLA